MGSVPVRWSRFSPRASSLSVLFTMPSMRFALRAWTSCGIWPAASISSTIQYQFPTVSSATGEPRSQVVRNCCRAPRVWAIRPSYRRAPSTVSTDTWVYRLWASKAMYSMAARLLSAGTLPASFRVGRSILCGPQEAQRFHAIK